MAKTKGQNKLNLNDCSREDLMQIEGIGKKTADHIIQFRDQQGGRFNSVDDLNQVPGMTGSTVNKLRSKVIV